MRGFTIEMSFLSPLMLLLLISSVFGMFYFHDKSILAGAAYETVAVGASRAREEKGVGAGELEALFHERAGDKCIFFAGADAAAFTSDEEVQVTGNAQRRGMAVSVYASMPITEPEKKIRDIRRLKGLGNGTQDND